MHPAPDTVWRRRVVEKTPVAARYSIEQVWHHHIPADARNHRVPVVTAPDLAFQTFNVDLAAGEVE
ncbi:hypothetical protein ACFOHY_01070 [Rhizobium rosettiformans]|uniref:hypothetical protein n=1 Tax=Rhizobium rosettiformans TaxID=1368430 RepID=UPI00361CE52C